MSDSQRRMELNTSPVFRRLIVVSLVLVAATPWLSAVAPAQTSVQAPNRPRTTAAERRECDRLLAEARQAMDEGRFETADSLILRAEALAGRILGAALGRHAEEGATRFGRPSTTRRRASKPGEPQRPSQKFDPAKSAGTVENKPTAPAQGQLSAPPTGQDASSLPSLERTDKAITQNGLRRPITGNPAAEPTAEGGAVHPNENTLNRLPAAQAAELRQRSDALLIDARRALATGDLRRAAAVAQQAKAMNITYGFHDDSPAKVEALIRKATELSQADGGRPATEAARRARAELLMEQAEQLLRWRAYDEAERLATDAIALHATFGPFDANPQTLRERIAADRKKQPARAMPVDPAAGPPPQVEDAAALLAVRGPGRSEEAIPRIDQKSPRSAGRWPARHGRAVRPAGRSVESPRQFLRSARRPAGSGDAGNLESPGQCHGRGSRGGAMEVGPKYPVGSTLYDPQNDATRNVPAAANESQPAELESVPAGNESLPAEPAAQSGDAQALFQAGEQALKDRDTQQALQLFRRAYALRDQLDAPTAQRLQDHLQLLSASAGGRTAPAKTALDSATAKQQLAQSSSAPRWPRSSRPPARSPRRIRSGPETLDAARLLVEAAGVDSDVKGRCCGGSPPARTKWTSTSSPIRRSSS